MPCESKCFLLSMLVRPDFVGNGATRLDPVNCTPYYIFGGLLLFASLFLFPSASQINLFIVLRLRAHFGFLM